MDNNQILHYLNNWPNETLMDTLDITYTSVGAYFLEATMPVNPRVHQPLGLLHGGATAALVESVASAASNVFINQEKQAALGIELQCTHVKSKREGIVTARAEAVHMGKSLHIWRVEVKDEQGKLISHCKLTNMIIPKRG